MIEKRQFEYKGCQVTCFTNQEPASLFWDVNAGVLAPEGDNLFGTTWSTAEQYTRPELALERSAQLARQKIDEMQAPPAADEPDAAASATTTTAASAAASPTGSSTVDAAVTAAASANVPANAPVTIKADTGAEATAKLHAGLPTGQQADQPS